MSECMTSDSYGFDIRLFLCSEPLQVRQSRDIPMSTAEIAMLQSVALETILRSWPTSISMFGQKVAELPIIGLSASGGLKTCT